MPVSRNTGALLYMLARGNGARAIVEFGTSFGLSTVHLAAALRDNGGGKLIGTELESNKLAYARANLEAAGLADLVDIREGDALQTLARDLPDTVDLLLLDGHKPLYDKILSLNGRSALARRILRGRRQRRRLPRVQGPHPRLRLRLPLDPVRRGRRAHDEAVTSS